MTSDLPLAPVDALAGLAPYSVPRHPGPIDLRLDGNEGLAPPVGLVQRALAEADGELARRYPSARPLEAALAARLEITPDQVLATCGADDGLDRACRAFLAPGREIILPVPTFVMLPRYVQLVGATAREIPWPAGPYPIDQVEAAITPATAAIAVVTPNNPTGAVATPEDLRRLSRAAPHALLLVDLAYGEFADLDLTRAALELPNAVVFRTLSKAWGLAGLRVGYVAGPASVLHWFRAAGNPYAISGPSIAIAMHRLAEGQAAVDTFVRRVQAERVELASELARLGGEPLDSQANFVLVRLPDPLWARDALAGLGIAIRAWPGHPTLGHVVRITCPGDADQFDRLVAGLRAALRPTGLHVDAGLDLGPEATSLPKASASASALALVASKNAVAAARARGQVPVAWGPAAGADLASEGAARTVQTVAELVLLLRGSD